MTGLQAFIGITILALCALMVHRIRKKSNDDLAAARGENAKLEAAITRAQKQNAALEQSNGALEKELLESAIENRIGAIDKECEERNESKCLEQSLKLFQSLQPNIDDLCDILLDAAQKPLDNERLLHCQELAALGSANGGACAYRFHVQLAQIEAECQRRGLQPSALTPSALLAAWGKK